MPKNSPHIEHVMQALGDLFQEITNFPETALPQVGSRLESILPDDIVQEQIPLFMQKTLAAHAQKRGKYHEAVERGDHPRGQQLFSEKELLFAVLTYFARAVAPLELLNAPFYWRIRKGYVLIYRTSDEDEKPEGKSTPPVSTVQKNKLN